MFVFSFTVLSF